MLESVKWCSENVKGPEELTVLKVLGVLKVLEMPIYVGGVKIRSGGSTWREVAQVKGIFVAALRDQFGSFV